MQQLLHDYYKMFVQPQRHILRTSTRGWITVEKSITHRMLLNHFTGKNLYGTFAKYYLNFCILDFDDIHIDVVRSILISTFPNLENYQIVETSLNSYHVIIHINYKGNAVTPVLLQDIFFTALESTYKLMDIEKRPEVYPAKNRGVRLPFSPLTKIVNKDNTTSIINVVREFKMFCKSSPYDTSEIPTRMKSYHRCALKKRAVTGGWGGGVSPPKNSILEKITRDGFTRGNRHNQQLNLVFNCYVRGRSLEDTKNFTANILDYHHTTYNTSASRAKKEILSMYKWVNNKYKIKSLSVSSLTSLNADGIKKIISVCEGKLSLMKFSLLLIDYLMARKHKKFVNVHSDLLIHWSCRDTYLKYISFLEKAKIVTRYHHYQENVASKSIVLSSTMRQLLLSQKKKRLSDVVYNIRKKYKELINSVVNSKTYISLLLNKLSRNALRYQIEVIYAKNSKHSNGYCGVCGGLVSFNDTS